MKTTSKYLIVFLLVTIPSLSFKGNEKVTLSLNAELYSYEINKMQSAEFFYTKTLCHKYTTSVFRYEPLEINEELIISDLKYKEKLNELTETVKRILRKRKN